VYTLKKARGKDLDFIVKIDLEGEGDPGVQTSRVMSAEEQQQHRLKMHRFIRPSLNTGLTEWDVCPKITWVALEKGADQPIGLIMFMFRDMNSPTFKTFDIFDKFRRDIFPPDGRFCEIENLWVSAAYRRQGIASLLKQKAEAVARKNRISLIYTHTALENQHVVDLNLKLGYRIIRTGPLWDAYVRVSLVKDLR
jgi:ribosomal protein S18 acetylase RimI-like enzyme